MINKKIRNRFDPEVYEFYKPALDGPGFSMPFSETDIPAIREDEVVRHTKNTDTYICTTFDIDIDRDGAEPLPVRIYKPNTDSKMNGHRPVLLYFHGGGFVMGSIYDHDPLCGKLADECDSIVVSVEYRLAPEYPFPACIEDACDAARWAKAHVSDFGGDPDTLMAGGDSSGANISAVLAYLAKESKNGNDPFGYGDIPEIKYMILFYGVFGCMTLNESASAKEFGNGDYVLPNDMMNSCMELYIPKDEYPDGIDLDDPRIAPGKADLSDMPPSVSVTAEFDPLRDDGEEFASRLEEAGCKSKLIRLNGMMHGFVLYWQRFSKVEKMLSEVGTIIKKHRF